MMSDRRGRERSFRFPRRSVHALHVSPAFLTANQQASHRGHTMPSSTLVHINHEAVVIITIIHQSKFVSSPSLSPSACPSFQALLLAFLVDQFVAQLESNHIS
jgi:hypothetical protein